MIYGQKGKYQQRDWTPTSKPKKNSVTESTIIKMKYSLEGFRSRFEQAEESANLEGCLNDCPPNFV